MRRTPWPQLALAVTLLSIAVGCEGDGEDRPTRGTVMVAGDPEEIDAYRAVPDTRPVRTSGGLMMGRSMVWP